MSFINPHSPPTHPREPAPESSDPDQVYEYPGTRALGYQVTPAGDGQHALETFSSGSDQFDLLITDYTMPGLTGIDLIILKPFGIKDLSQMVRRVLDARLEA